MKKVRIPLYKARIGDKKWLDDAISGWTAIWNFPWYGFYEPEPKRTIKTYAKAWWGAIKRWWKDAYSHVELWVPDNNPSNVSCDKFKSIIPQGNPQFHDCPPPITQDYAGTCYTSTMRGDAKGVVKRPASEILKHPERWDYIEIEMSEADYSLMILLAEEWIHNNAGYDFKAIGSFFLPWRIHSKRKFICSELVYELLWMGEIFDKGNQCPSPRRLSRWLTKKGYVIKPLKE